jgi:4-amino-4-deoxy-L-arabinose transferase-like glycosyltransferase
MILILIFISLFLIIKEKDTSINHKEGLIVTSLVFLFLLFSITLGLSFIKKLNFNWLFITWLLVEALLIFILFKLVKFKLTPFISNSVAKFKEKKYSLLEKYLLLLIISCLSALFFQGLLYPPNNFDSLTYHLTRIIFWISNESVLHYQSNVLRDLYQPPLVEYILLNINLLNGNDLFSNSIQLFFLCLSIIVLVLILDVFKINRSNKIVAIIFLITIPSVLLQATNTKNDIVAGFFVLTSIYYTYQVYLNMSLKQFILLGLSVGLGVLVKGTVYLFLAPVLFFGFVFIIAKIISNKNFKALFYGLTSLSIVLFLNINHFYQNSKIGDNFFSIDNTEGQAYNNAKINLEVIESNLLKNIGLHIDYPFQENYDYWLKRYHYLNEIPLNTIETNFLNYKYVGPKRHETHEDLTPNSIHLYLSLFLGMFLYSIFYYKKNKRELILVLIMSCMVIIFVGYLKWQPHHTRLHIPLFMLSVVLITIAISKIKYFVLIISPVYLILIYNFIFLVTYNNSRPVVNHPIYTKEIKIKDSRYKKYFSNYLIAHTEYENINKILNRKENKKIGLIMYDWKYPLIKDFYNNSKQILNLDVVNYSNKIKQNEENIDVVVSNLINQDKIIKNNEEYINLSKNNTFVWYYKKIKP